MLIGGRGMKETKTAHMDHSLSTHDVTRGKIRTVGAVVIIAGWTSREDIIRGYLLLARPVLVEILVGITRCRLRLIVVMKYSGCTGPSH